MKKIISIFYDIRKDEWRSALLMFGLHFILMVVLYFLKPARDSLFLVEIGPQELPYVYILLAAFSIPVTILLTKVMTLYSIRTVFIWTLGILGLNILLIRWLFQFDLDFTFMLFYIWVGIFSILVISLFWILANAVFKPAQSKRIFSFLTFAAIIGAIAGSQASSLIVSQTSVSTENLLYISVLLLATAIGILFFLKVEDNENEEGDIAYQNEEASTLSTIKKVFQSRYQLIIGGIVGIAMVTTTFTDYQFKALSFEAFPDKKNLTSFLGNFYAGISLASLAIQMLFSSTIIKRMGISGAILTRPAGMMIAAVLLAIEPLLASVVLLNGFDGASRYSIDKNGRELLFLPLSQSTKEQTKVFIDIFVDRFSRGFAGLLLLAFIAVLNWSAYLLTYAVIFLLVIWIFLGIVARKEYVQKFRDSIQKQLISSDSNTLNLDEAKIYSVIRESLHSDNDAEQLHSLILLESSNAEKVTDDLIDLLDHDNSQIKLQALKLLQNVDSVDLIEKVQKLLEDPAPEIRLETIYYLCGHSSEDPSKVIRSYLSHDDLKLRAAAIGCASKHADESAFDLVDPEFFDQLLTNESKDSIVIKAQLADALGYINNDNLAEHYLAKLLDDEHPSVVRKAISSIKRQKKDQLIPQLFTKLENTEYRIDAIKALASYSKSHLILYKNRFFDEQVSLRIRKSIPDIFSYYQKQIAVDHLYEMLDINRPDLRYHVLKALNKLKRKNSFLQMEEHKIRSFIRQESSTYFRLLEVKKLQPSDRPNQILIQALTEKMREVVERIFRFLGLIYNTNDMYGSYLSIQSISSEKQSSALEFLDNVLDEEDLKFVFPVIDNQEESKKIEAGRNLFNISRMSYDEGLIQLMEGEDIWLKVCSVYSVSPKCPIQLQDKVEEASHSSNDLVKETAQMVKKRNAKQST